MTSEQPSVEQRPISVRSIYRMLWKQKLKIGFIWVVTAALAVTLVYKLPAIYRAETLILVDSQKIPDKYVTATVDTDVQDRLATISQQILSSTRLQKIIEDFNLYRQERKTKAQEEVIEAMRNDIEIKLEKGWTQNRPGAFRIAFQGENAAVVAEVANRLANLYIEENLRAREVQAEGTTEFIESQLHVAKKALDEQEARLSQYKLQHNGELPQQEGSLLSALGRLQTELQGNQEAINRAQQNRQMLENAVSIAEASEAALNQMAEQIVGGKGGPGSPSPASSSQPPKPKKSERLNAELESLRSRYSDEHPEIKRLQRDLVRQLEEEAAQTAVSDASPEKTEPATVPAPAKPAVMVDLAQSLVKQRERVANQKSQLALAERDLKMRATDRERILREITARQYRVEKLPLREQEMAALLRDHEISKSNYKSLLEKKLAAEMATDLERRQKGERFTVLDAASVPEKPYKPNRPLLAALGCTLGLALSMAAGVGREWTNNKLLGEWELPSGIPILGRVPSIDARSSRPGGGKRLWRIKLTQRLRLAVASSALLSMVIAFAAGYYFGWSR